MMDHETSKFITFHEWHQAEQTENEALFSHGRFHKIVCKHRLNKNVCLLLNFRYLGDSVAQTTDKPTHMPADSTADPQLENSSERAFCEFVHLIGDSQIHTTLTYCSPPRT
jgi:hypothetical protein